MTVISLTIPDELESALLAIPGSVEAFILDAVRSQLLPHQWASDSDLEEAAVADSDDDFLSQQDIQYYLALPNA
jgi:hypothetical protein